MKICRDELNRIGFLETKKLINIFKVIMSRYMWNKPIRQ